MCDRIYEKMRVFTERMLDGGMIKLWELQSQLYCRYLCKLLESILEAIACWLGHVLDAAIEDMLKTRVLLWSSCGSFFVLPPGDNTRYTTCWPRLEEKITLFIVSYKQKTHNILIQLYFYMIKCWIAQNWKREIAGTNANKPHTLDRNIIAYLTIFKTPKSIQFKLKKIQMFLALN